MVGEEHLERCTELRRLNHEGARGRSSSWLFSVIASIGLCLAHPAGADMAPVLPIPDHPARYLRVPEDFSVSVFVRLPAGGGDMFRGPRFMAFGPDGHLYLSLGFDDKVVMLPDRNRDGRADEVVTVADHSTRRRGWPSSMTSCSSPTRMA